MAKTFADVTEIPGLQLTSEAMAQVATRYRLAARHAAGKRVLEVAAGPGIGLAFLSRGARSVVGTDLLPNLVRQAQAASEGRVGLAAADAQLLPFRDASFDLVLVFEGIYYLPDIDAFIAEARRALAPGGMLLLSTANKERIGFVKSPLSTTYHSADELREKLEEHGFDAVMFGAFPVPTSQAGERALQWAYGMAGRFRLVPRSLEGRARLKRLIYGKMVPAPRSLDEDMPAGEEPVPLADDARDWKVIYAVARKRGGPPMPPSRMRA